MILRCSKKRPVTQTLVAGVFVLFEAWEEMESAVIGWPRIGSRLLPSPAPGTSVATDVSRKYLQPWITAPCTGPALNPRPSRYSESTVLMLLFRRKSFPPSVYVVVPGPRRRFGCIRESA